MPRWASWGVSGLALVALGVLVSVIGVQEYAAGVVFAGQAIAGAGMWVLVVAAVILGAGIAQKPIEARLRKLERGLDRLLDTGSDEPRPDGSGPQPPR